MTQSLREFREERERMNERVLEVGGLGIQRFFALDARTYEEGALDARTKELLGLAASTALRCDDCITYHLVRCVEEGAGDDEIMEALNVALVVGGSIVIPHLRRAVARLQEIRGER
jgi:AhpD family alkylhydroperoxidase